MSQLPRYSASKIDTFSKCPTWFYSRYHLKEKVAVETTYAYLGTGVHSAIQAGYEETGFPYHVLEETVRDKFAALEGKQWSGYTYTDILRKGYAILDAYEYEQYSPLHMEYEFLLPFPNVDTPICELHGFIDLITTDGKVIDFKTNSKAPPKREVDSSIQLTLYAWAYSQLGGFLPEMVAIHHLPTMKVIEYDLNKFDENMARIVSLIEKMNTLDSSCDIGRCGNCNWFCARYGWGN